MNWIGIILGLITANFFWEWIKSETKWEAAVERSYFQMLAVFGVYLTEPWM